jgi:hypothetical protein
MSDIEEQRKPNTPKTRRSRAERPTRIPVSGNRDILTVQGLDPAYEHRWVNDSSENGQRIHRFLMGGWEFAPKENLSIGSEMVFTSENVGSIVRVPGGRGNYLYLMRIPKEWFEEDKAAKAAQILQTERKVTRKRQTDDEDGDYGEGKISTSVPMLERK